jgi:hypothetical protein
MKIICFLFGHFWKNQPTYLKSQLASQKCSVCGVHRGKIKIKDKEIWSYPFYFKEK